MDSEPLTIPALRSYWQQHFPYFALEFVKLKVIFGDFSEEFSADFELSQKSYPLPSNLAQPNTWCFGHIWIGNSSLTKPKEGL